MNQEKATEYTYGMHGSLDIGQPIVRVALSARAQELGIQPPVVHNYGDAGIDLAAMLEKDELQVNPGECLRVPTGLFVQFPNEDPCSSYTWIGEVTQRTGLALKGIIPLPKVIDSGYRPDPESPEGTVLGIGNVSNKPYVIERGLRVAQLVVKRVLSPGMAMQVVSLDQIDFETERGDGRFGSTGMR